MIGHVSVEKLEEDTNQLFLNFFSAELRGNEREPQSHMKSCSPYLLQHVLSLQCIVVHRGSCQCEAVISASPVMDFSPYDF